MRTEWRKRRNVEGREIRGKKRGEGDREAGRLRGGEEYRTKKINK